MPVARNYNPGSIIYFEDDKNANENIVFSRTVGFRIAYYVNASFGVVLFKTVKY